MTNFLQHIFAIMLLLLLPNKVEANTEAYETALIKANYMIDGETITQLIYQVTNTSDENIWLLFNKDNAKTTQNLIQERYLSKQEGGSSLFDMITDPNALFGDWILDINSSFLKIITPHKSFYVIITYRDEMAAFNIIDRIRLIPMRELIKIRSSLRIIDPDNHTTYQPDCISIQL